ncbi:hypothetical protein AB835_10350 [Candidatus Endobugula sertula]|uniref:LysM domain-containing protein n=1 Tax=Candidatus Endobugula sertula TaxID=62101 RepID=A0A1D2QNK5_9GAMM|nr:hypothetical protein AB835_10350 [Candidatus Endobugula sertula]
MKKVVFNHLFLWCFSLGAVLPTYAEDALFREGHPKTYSVVKGDTLWGISERFLKDPWRWTEVWEANSRITNPHLIYPGDIIRLIVIDGQPRLTIERGNDRSTTTTTHSNTLTKTSSDKKTLKTVKLSPKIHPAPIKQRIDSIPLEKINSFLLGNRIVDKVTLLKAPHVIAGPEQRVILGTGDNLYARGDFSSSIRNYGIYRQGKSYIDPKTRKVLGIQAIYIGSASRRAFNKPVATFAISESIGEVRVGDRLLPKKERQIMSTFFPKPLDSKVEGMIMAIERGIQAGKFDIVAINLGHNVGLSQGHLLTINKRGERIRDRFAQKGTPKVIDLPNERSGLVLIFQTFEKMSLGIILEADKGISIRDLVRSP